MVPGTGIEPVWLAPRDFKSLVSTNFTIRAFDLIRELAAVCGRKSLDRRVIGNETKRNEFWSKSAWSDNSTAPPQLVLSISRRDCGYSLRPVKASRSLN